MGCDLTGKTDAHGKLHALLGIIDHGSRALLHLQALHDKTTHTLIACISEVIRTHGKPKAIRTDNEGMFRSPAFGNALKQLGIRHQRTTPGCPWQNGRIERLFGTLKDKLDQRIYSPRPQAGLREGRCAAAGYPPAYSLRVKGLGVREEVMEQLNRDLSTFQHWYNHVRPHQNLDGRTPAEAWRGINPYAKPPKQEHWFEAWDGLLAGYELRY
jgi:putative transposase